MTRLIGTGPNQVPTNADLGSMAFQQADSVNIYGGTVEAAVMQSPEISDAVPALNFDFTNRRLDNRIKFTRWSGKYYYDGKTSIAAEQNWFRYSEQLAMGDPNNGATQTGVSGSFGWTYWDYMVGLSNHSGTTDPLGGYRASRFMETSDNNIHWVYFSRQNYFSHTKPWCYSVYFKSVNTGITRYIRMVVYYDSTQYVIIQANLANGSVVNAAQNSSAGTSLGQTSANSGNDNFGQEMPRVIGGGTISVGNGWYRMYLIFHGFADSCGISLADSTTTGFASAAGTYGRCTYAGNTSAGVYLWGAQAEQREYLGPYVASTHAAVIKYQPVLVRANVHEPAFAYDPVTGESRGIWLESGAGNHCRSSEDLTNANWTKNNVTIGTGTTSSGGVNTGYYWAPSGAFNACKVIESGSGVKYIVPTPFSARTDNEYWTMSIFVREDKRDMSYGPQTAFSDPVSIISSANNKKRYFWMGGTNNTASAYAFIVFDLEKMIVTQRRAIWDGSDRGYYYFGDRQEAPNWDNGLRWSIEDCGNNWRRMALAIYVNLGGSGTTWNLCYGITNNPRPESWSDLGYSGDGSTGMWMWGAQIEGIQRYNIGRPTSYIPTLHTYYAYRNSDALVVERDDIYNATHRGFEGTAYINTASPQPGPHAMSIYADIEDPVRGGSQVVNWIGNGRLCHVSFSESKFYGPDSTSGGYMDTQNAEFAYNADRTRMPIHTRRDRFQKVCMALADGDWAMAQDSSSIPSRLQLAKGKFDPCVIDWLGIGTHYNELAYMSGGMRKLQIYFCRLPNREIIEKVN